MPIPETAHRVEVFYHAAPSWLVAETSRERAARMRSRRAALPEECYPGNYSGRVISIRPVEDVESGGLPSLRDMSDKAHPVVVLDLDADGVAAIVSGRSKIVGGRAAPVTFDDRFGAVAPTLRERHADAEAWERDDIAAREAAEAANAKAMRTQDRAVGEWRVRMMDLGRDIVRSNRSPNVTPPTLPDRPKPPTLIAVPESSFDRAVADLGDALPPPVTHTGTGLYAVKVTPTHRDDTQSGAVIKNNLTYSDDITHADWVRSSGGTGTTPTVTGDAADAPEGGGRACRVAFDKGAGNGLGDTSWLHEYKGGLANPHDSTIAVWMKSADGNTYNVAMNEGEIGVLAGAQVVSVTPTWQRFVLTNLAVASAATYPQIGLTGTLGCSETADVYVWRGEMSTTAAANPAPGLKTLASAMSGVVFTTGGLGTVNAFQGGYVTNATRAETRAILDHGDDTASIEGDLSAWLDTDDLDVYDAWSTIGALLSQLETDQGTGTAFTSTQIARIYTGTYTENVSINDAVINPTEEYPMVFEAGSGTPVIQNSGANTTWAHAANDNCFVYDGLHFKNDQANKHSFSGYICGKMPFTNCIFESTIATTYGAQFRGHSGLMTGCRFIGGLVNLGVELVRGCTFEGVAGIIVWNFGLRLENCTGYMSGASKCFSSISNYGLVSVSLANCSFYGDGTSTFFDADQASGQAMMTLRNCVITNWGKVFDLGADRTIDSSVDADFNCYNGNTVLGTFAGSDYTTLAQWQAADIPKNFFGTTATPDANSIDSDPLMTDPANGDFDLGAGSPCIRAASPAGVTEDVDGDQFATDRTDMGAVSSGTSSTPPVISKATASPSSVAVTVTAAGAPNVRVRLSNKSGAEEAEEQRLGAGAVALTPTTSGNRYVVAWGCDATGHPIGEPSAPVRVDIPAAVIAGGPTRRRSNRAQVALAFTEALANVRNGAYRVHRGPVTWVAFDFDVHQLGATVILAESPLNDSGEATIVLELFSAWHERPIERNAPLDDLTLDDLYEDARLVVHEANNAHRRDGQSVLAGVILKRATVEEVYVQGIIMGIVVTIPVGF